MTPPTMPGLPPLSDSPAMGVRRFGRVNWLGLRTLARREVMRFMAVWQQTIFAPLMTAGLFVVENTKVAAELVTAGHAFEEIYATPAATLPVTLTRQAKAVSSPASWPDSPAWA